MKEKKNLNKLVKNNYENCCYNGCKSKDLRIDCIVYGNSSMSTVIVSKIYTKCGKRQ